MTERWKPIDGYPGYEVSDLGHVREVGGEVLEQKRVDGRKRYVLLRRPGRTDRKQVHVHRLVAEAFVDNPNGKAIVDHIDHDATNNAASNLMWCTQSERAHRAPYRDMCSSGFKGGFK